MLHKSQVTNGLGLFDLDKRSISFMIYNPTFVENQV